jgi:hypothetical protein
MFRLTFRMGAFRRACCYGTRGWHSGSDDVLGSIADSIRLGRMDVVDREREHQQRHAEEENGADL